MTDDIIKMNYAEMEEMSNIFKKAGQDLEDLKKNMQKLADVIDGGGLIGDAGTAFSSGIRQELCTAIDKLSAKMKELSTDIWGAKEFIEHGDQEAQSRFKN